MAADGEAVIFISHKLAEVTAVSDNVTVMRDGRVVERVKTSSTSRRELARMMVGRDVDLSVRRSMSPPGPVLLALEGVGLAGEQDANSLQEINLELRGGEIVGIAGVAGNGQRELAEVVAGLRPPSSGTVRIAGKDVTGAGASAARKAGLAYVP
jgi:general nucleoside transport system ATP-binding protein